MRSLLAALIVSSGLLAGCSFDSVVGLVDPYRIDIRQGNYVDQEMVAQLRRGMTRDQALQFVLPRHALHAHRLRLPHPRTGAPFEVVAPLAWDLAAFLAAQR